MFKPKRQVDFEGSYDKKENMFLDENGRRDLFLEEHKMYKENKLEQQERIELYYLLEQMYKQPSKSGDDAATRAQEHLKEYFSEPENTFFYEKNKIR